MILLLPLPARPPLITPTPSPRVSLSSLPCAELPSPVAVHHAPASSPMIGPRHSLPHFTLAKPSKRLNHRQSAPDQVVTQEEDIFDKRFLVVEFLGKGAFSQVVKVKERDGDGVFAVKKARGVFEGVKDRLRHLEEVDILRHLSLQPHPNVLTFVDAWEQVSAGAVPSLKGSC